MTAGSGQKRKRNHWVPQVYLRAFAVDEKRQKIWRFSNVKGSNPELKPIEKVAVKHHLYTQNTAEGRDYSFEAKLSSLERLFATPLWESACSGVIDLEGETTRKAISLLMAVMYLRNPAQLEVAAVLHRELVRAFSDNDELPDEIEINGVISPVSPAEWPSFRDAGEDEIRNMWIEDVGSATWLAELFMVMRWSMIFAEEPVFITSDHPVTVMHPSMRFRGFKNAETQVLFPISPTRILMLDNRHTEPSGLYYPLVANVGAFNVMLFRGATKHFFSSRHPDLVCQEICDDADDEEARAAREGSAGISRG